MAETHTEIYRPFEGRLRSRALRFLPLCLAGIRVAARRKLPLILLFTPPAITGIVSSFIVYAKFSLEQEVGTRGVTDAGLRIAIAMARQMTQVHNQIVGSQRAIQTFALLVIAWFGAGLIAEDRKQGAHLLYFSRPLTRLDYFLGHFCTVAFYGLCAVLGPGLLICTVATFSSPDYSFLKEEWDVIAATFGFALVCVGVLAALVLAVSSLVNRKSFALAGVFGLVVASQAVGGVMSELEADEDFLMIGIWSNLFRLADWMFGARRPIFHWDPRWSVVILSSLFVLCVGVCAWRIRRLEVVA